jgi:hypothetical protein
MRNLRLRQWLVLLLRMLAIACLALAFARPALQEGSGWLDGARPTTAVLLVDRSYSTRHAPPGGRLFDRLRRAADEILGLYGDGRDRVHLIPFAARVDTIDGPLSVAAWRERLADLAPGEARTDIDDALRAAADRLAAAPGTDGEIFLLTDATRAGWEEVRAVGDGSARVFVVVPNIGSGRNLFVGDHRVAAWLAAPGHPLTVSAQVGQSGGDETSVAVDLFLDGQRLQRRQVQLSPGGVAAVDFTVAPRRSGLLTGFVQIEDDDLPLDNRRHFTIRVPERTAVLLAGPHGTDTYYARRGLTAAATGDATLEVESMVLSELSSEALARTDVLVLCNLEAPTAAVSRIVRRFAEAGGGVLAFPGPEADLSRWNRELLPAILPATLAGVTGRPGAEAYVSLDTSRVYGELFSGLLDAVDDRPRFQATFDVVTDRQLSVLARFDDGRPALVEGRPGAGRVLLWAAPLDQSWSDWPLRGSFVPLLHRLTRSLALAAPQTADYTVGDRAWRWIPGARVDDRLQIQAPSGRRFFIEAHTSFGELRWDVPRLNEAGIWRILNSDGAALDEFAVNVDPVEADLTRWTQAEMAERLAGQRLHFLDEALSTERILALRYGRELWRECLLLAGLLLMLELWIARAPASKAPAQAA